MDKEDAATESSAGLGASPAALASANANHKQFDLTPSEKSELARVNHV